MESNVICLRQITKEGAIQERAPEISIIFLFKLLPNTKIWSNPTRLAKNKNWVAFYNLQILQQFTNLIQSLKIF